ncbi:MAG: deoxyribose-phosphate aldolase [Bacteroidetes bacterium 4484_276]|nr:MAG: deoxyribose-phosphate aldolase [Bacteroidetes bacterium 4484_276]
MIDFNIYNPTKEAIKSRINGCLSSKLSENERNKALRTLLNCIDLTSLEGSDTKVKIFSICERAKTFNKEGKDIPNVAAVCFYPPFIGLAKKLLEGTDIKVATVAAGFPAGQTPLPIKMAEVKYAVDEGADEIDIVISRGKLLANNCREVYDEVSKLKELSNEAKLKVILETGELETVFKIRRASEISIKAGADFLKTSTGKIKPAATPEAFLIMLDTIKEYHEKTGIKIGIKAAGGISEPEDALVYYQLVKHVLGKEWLNNKLFRIGASRLANKLVDEIKGL